MPRNPLGEADQFTENQFVQIQLAFIYLAWNIYQDCFNSFNKNVQFWLLMTKIHVINSYPNFFSHSSS